MDWHEAAADGLPAPRNDEPASLRQDILDELADHLDCALKRELTKNITPDEAVENVKRRFGDPRDLAHRLWLDAMKDTIMSKRLTLAAMGLMTVTCLLLVVFAWRALVATQQAALHAQAASERLMVALAARPAPGPGGTERAHVLFHLVQDDAEKSPAQGVEATFFLNRAGSNLAALKRKSDVNGDLDFGMLPAGSYMLNLTMPWQESTLIPLEVSPAFPITSSIACPAHDWPPVDVEFEFAGMPSLKNSDSLIVCRIGSTPTRTIGNDGWSHPNPTGGPEEEFDLILDSGGQIIDFGKAAATDPRAEPVSRRWWLQRVSGPSGPMFQTLAPSKRFDWLVQRLKSNALSHTKNAQQLNFRARNYELKWMVVLLAADLRRLAGEGSKRDELPKTILTGPPGETPFVLGVNLSGDSHTAPLRPTPGQKNVWNIKISPDFTGEISRMLLSSASTVPPPANDAVAKSDAAVGAALLKTLEAMAVPDHTPDGLTGLRLTSIGDSVLIKSGLQNDDLVIGVEGWHVNNNRELGLASRHPITARETEAGIPAELLMLVCRDGKTGLRLVRTSNAPRPEPAKPSKAAAPAKASAENVEPSNRFRGRRRASQPG
ncbi:MAG TPA: hypothetical protein VGP76_01365 [Planctomycetaceae bacterium]|jgi:hypothetical protein|nr:hypothetical protein [Planctomycetaceae bacterium]